MLKGGSEEGGFTTLEFERKLDTCDEEDLPINFVSCVLLQPCISCVLHVPSSVCIHRHTFN